MRTLLKIGLVCVVAIGALAQESTPPTQSDAGAAPGMGQRGMRAGMRGSRVMGEITAVSSDGFTVKEQNGETKQVKVTGDTRVIRNRQPIKLSDLKVGMSVMAAGDPDASNPSLINARFVVDDTERMKEFKENLGKTVIAGEVKAINEAQLTILRPDGQTQVIEADENTSFQKGRNSITLADIKPGDHVMGRGSVKNGVFVPTNLRVGGMGGPGGFGTGRGGPGGFPPAGGQSNTEQQPQ